MSERSKWIMWGLQVVTIIGLAILGGCIRGKPIDIPPLPAPPISDPQPPDKQPPQTPTDPPPDTLNAIVKIRTTVGGCSAVFIIPRRPDGRYDILSAAHCFSTIGENVDVMFRNGRTTSAKVVNIDRRADCAWLVTATNGTTFPGAYLAERSPAVGEKIWHAGFGVDNPGNREEGEVLSAPQPNGRIRLRLSVSSGDSGGGFAVDKDGRIFSTCCCTVWDGRSRWTEGASTERIRAIRHEQIDLWDWVPVPLPRLDPEGVPEKMPEKK